MNETNTKNSTNLALRSALTRLEGDVDLLCTALEAFLDSVPGTVQVLRSACQEKDASTLLAAAKLMKDSAQNIGAEPVYQLANEIRLIAATGSVENCTDLIEALMDQVQNVRPTIQDYLDGEKDA